MYLPTMGNCLALFLRLLSRFYNTTEKPERMPGMRLEQKLKMLHSYQVPNHLGSHYQINFISDFFVGYLTATGIHAMQTHN